MKLIITGRQMEVSKGIQQYIRKRFGKFSNFLHSNAEVHVTVKVEGYRNTVEVNAKNGPYAVAAKQTTKDLHSAIDLLSEKVGHQLTRQHDRLLRKSSTVGSPKALQDTVAAPARKETPAPGRIQEVESWSGKPMTSEEAALQMQGSKQPFMVFEEVHSGQLNVLVRRKDGNFKLIVKE